MIIVISPEQDVEGEMDILNQLFEAGLEYYHLRKPFKNHTEYRAYLQQIKPCFHPRIVLHSCHDLTHEFDLKGIHFQEKSRGIAIESGEMACFRERNGNDKTISSSFHEPKDLANAEFDFDYHLLSPVFASISKQGYQGRGFDVNHIDKTIIGMGGVTSENIQEFQRLGFKGVGVLGGIWNSTRPVESFNKMKIYFEY